MDLDPKVPPFLSRSSARWQTNSLTLSEHLVPCQEKDQGQEQQPVPSPTSETPSGPLVSAFAHLNQDQGLPSASSAEPSNGRPTRRESKLKDNEERQARKKTKNQWSEEARARRDEKNERLHQENLLRMRLELARLEATKEKRALTRDLAQQGQVTFSGNIDINSLF